MKKQMAKIQFYGTYRVIYDDSKRYNPYIVYSEHDGKDKKLDAYADMESALRCISTVAMAKKAYR